MLIKHEVQEMDDQRYWCEECFMAFRKSVKGSRGHLWTRTLLAMANIRKQPGHRRLEFRKY